MKTYRALIKAQVGASMRAIPTDIRAQSSSDAKWLLQAVYGFHAVVSVPTEVQDMKITEITNPTTPEQQKIKALKAQKDHAADALKTERDRQKRAKAVQTIGALNAQKPMNVS